MTLCVRLERLLSLAAYVVQHLFLCLTSAITKWLRLRLALGGRLSLSEHLLTTRRYITRSHPLVSSLPNGVICMSPSQVSAVLSIWRGYATTQMLPVETFLRSRV